MHDTMVGEHMVSSPHCVPPEISLHDGLDLLKRLRIRHLPVIRGNQLVGVVSERDIVASIEMPLATNLTIGDIMHRQVYVADATTPLSEVAHEMAESKYGCAIIVNANKHVIGIFTTVDALKVLAELGNEDAIESFLTFEEDY